MTRSKQAGRSAQRARNGARVFAAVAALAAALGAPAAHAVLGGAPMATPDGAALTRVVSVPAGAAPHAAAAVSASSAAAAASAPYTVRETALANGTVVREYLSDAGTVFGIAWQGPRMPDLDTLLGAYFPQYASQLNANRARGLHGQAAVDSGALSVRSGGHMGAFTGRAWLAQALPAGVSAADIQ